MLIQQHQCQIQHCLNKRQTRNDEKPVHLRMYISKPTLSNYKHAFRIQQSSNLRILNITCWCVLLVFYFKYNDIIFTYKGFDLLVFSVTNWNWSVFFDTGVSLAECFNRYWVRVPVWISTRIQAHQADASRIVRNVHYEFHCKLPQKFRLNMVLHSKNITKFMKDIFIISFSDSLYIPCEVLSFA